LNMFVNALATNMFKNALASFKNNGFLAALREAKSNGYLGKILIDGNLLHTKMRAHEATLIGTDNMGNKYYERMENTQFGRHRWVEYADNGNYNASAVPPEWHSWLHYISDHTADQLLELKPKTYGVAHRENQSGRGDGIIHYSKGHALNPTGRDWKRYQAWQPENPDSNAKSSPTSPNSV